MEIHGILYKPGAIVVLDCDLMPVFGVVKEIVNINSCFYLVCNLLHTVCFVHHIHAYEVQELSIVKPIKVNSLYDHHPLGLYKSPLDNSIMVVPLKYHIIENL